MSEQTLAGLRSSELFILPGGAMQRTAWPKQATRRCSRHRTTARVAAKAKAKEKAAE